MSCHVTQPRSSRQSRSARVRSPQGETSQEAATHENSETFCANYLRDVHEEVGVAAPRAAEVGACSRPAHGHLTRVPGR